MTGSIRLAGRTLARCQALQLLFQAEVTGRAVSDVLDGDYVLSKGPLDEYGREIALGTYEHEAELDSVLSHAAHNWSLSRMSGVDRNLLRLSLYEMLYVEEVQTPVVISECVELAKAFGSSDESSRFVNGVLGRIATDVANGKDVVEAARKLDAEEAAAYERARQEDRYSDDAYSDEALDADEGAYDTYDANASADGDGSDGSDGARADADAAGDGRAE